MAAAATSFATLVSSPYSSLSARHLFQSSSIPGPSRVAAGHRAAGDGSGGGIRAAGPPRLQGLLAAPILQQCPPPLTGRFLLRGPSAFALPQPRALRHIRQRRTQGAIFTAADYRLLCFNLYLEWEIYRLRKLKLQSWPFGQFWTYICLRCQISWYPFY